jgi:transposase-like protein
MLQETVDNMKKELRNQARQMRQEGESVRQIALKLNVSKSTISNWVRDIQLTAAQVETLRANQRSYAAQNSGSQANRTKFRQLREQYQEAGKQKASEMRPLHLAGCMLYWAEGAKHRNRLYFANSDPNMHRLFIRFLREELQVRDADIAIYLHCHTSDPDEITGHEDFWLELLGLSLSNMRKTYIKKGSTIQHSILQHGVCGVNINRVDLVQHIFGAIQAYGDFENPAWLG